MEIAALQEEVFHTAVEHGWWPLISDTKVGDKTSGVIVDQKDVNIPEKLALMHSELSEALEHFRHGNMEMFISVSGKPDGFWIELADCIIRILDTAGAYGIDMEYMLRVKADYNKTRPYRHG